VAWLGCAAILAGLVALDGAKRSPIKDKGCHHDGSGVSICPNPDQG
jgi:hypothetical protein